MSSPALLQISVWAPPDLRLLQRDHGRQEHSEVEVFSTQVFTVHVALDSEQSDPAIRENARQLLVDALADVTADIDIVPREGNTASSPDLSLQFDGHRLALMLRTASTVRPQDVPRLYGQPPGNGIVPIVVADRIPQAARRALSEQGWSWLDRRGHLWLRAPGVLLDRSVPATTRPVGAKTGRAWREVAFALLAEPDAASGVRPLARHLDLSAAAVSMQLTALREVSLIDSRGRALVPELFWELASRWRTTVLPLARPPLPGDPHSLGLGLDGSQGPPGLPVGTPGWALTGTLAALTWGAPLAASGTWPPDFLVPTPEQAGRAQRQLGAAADWAARGCTISVAPVRQATVLRYEPPHGRPAAGAHWLLAHPVAVALDLAQDKARGSEMLTAWAPEGFTRVW